MDSLETDMREKDYVVHVSILVEHLHHCHKLDRGACHWEVFIVHDNPKQGIATDCGVFMLKTLQYWAQGKRLPFSKDNASGARYVLLQEINDKKLAVRNTFCV